MTVIQGLGLLGGSDHRLGMDNCLTAGAETSYELAIADALGGQALTSPWRRSGAATSSTT